jgi:hypothetical protein
VNPLRLDGTLTDGDGGPYWLLTVVLPGFRLFRYPGKLLTFTCLALSALAGIGWDALAAGAAARAESCTRRLLAVSLLCLGLSLASRRWLETWLASQAAGGSTPLGPLDAARALSDLRWSFVHATFVLLGLLVVFQIARRRPHRAAVWILPLMTLDLAVANAPLVLTLPQSVFETRPALLDVIDRAEQADPAPGPFRVYRLTQWDPVGWYEAGSPDRIRDLVTWRRKTLEAKYGIAYGVEYALTQGTAELDDYRWFFHPMTHQLPQALASALRAKPGATFVYYPRRGLDLWNARYFVLPFYPRWSDPRRGTAAFLSDATLIAPVGGSGDAAEAAADPSKRWDSWIKREDWQVLRNPSAFPRAWVVHQVRPMPPAPRFALLPGQARLEELLYPGDTYWTEPGRPVHDPHVTAWVEANDLRGLDDVLPGGRPGSHETVAVQYHGPQEVELDARLERPGLVILSDIAYPGWRLRIDGRPAAILRVNGVMRGALVTAGAHRLLYTYEPWSFKLGLATSCAGLVMALAVWIAGRRR